MPNTVTTYLLFGNFYSTTVADDTFVTNPFIFTTSTFEILYRSENPFAEKTIALRFVRSVVDSFRFQNFTTRFSEDVILDPYLGTFGSTTIPLKVTFKEENGMLMATATGQQSFPLTPAGTDKFLFEQGGVTIQFNASKSEFTLSQGDMSIKFTREK